MLFLHEYRPTGRRLADHLPWAALIAPGLVLNKDGSFQTTFRFRGPDLVSATTSEHVAARARLNNALRRLGSRWCLHIEARRARSASYPSNTFTAPLPWLVDEERRRTFTEAGARFESDYFLTFTYLPERDAIGRAAALLIEGADESENDPSRYAASLKRFQSASRLIIDLLGACFPEIAALSDTETLTYLHACVSTKRHDVHPPLTPAYLDAVLTDDDFVGGLAPRLGSNHLRVISVRAFPDTSTPALLSDLDALGLPYRWVSRWMPLDKEAARRSLTTIRRRWFAKRKGVAGLLKEALTRESAILEDGAALAKTRDADEALLVLGADASSFGHFTPTITVTHPTAAEADGMARLIESTINRAGLVARIEDVNAAEAWLGSLPGHAYADVRRPLLSSLNVCDLIPATATWSGPRVNEHLTAHAKGLGLPAQPALLHAVAAGSTPFRLDLHVGDVGHTLIVGPTGAGKSVLLNILALQWLRYPNAQVIMFDKGASARATTILAGGNWIHLSRSQARCAFQPMLGLDRPDEARWLLDWTLDLLATTGFSPDARSRGEIWAAFTSLAGAPPDQRTLSLLAATVQDRAVRAALGPYTLSGAFGSLFDSDREDLADGRWRTFELGELLELRTPVAPALTYLFHRLESGFDGRPTLVVLDEAWLFLGQSAFAAKIREWLKTLRKRNVSVVFATQSIGDILESDLSTAVVESCPTRILLPNPDAVTPATAHAYRKLGVNERERELLARATPKRDYYLKSPRGSRLFELGLGPIATAAAASTGSDDQQLLERLLKQEKAGDIVGAFLRAKGLNLARTALDQIPNDHQGEPS